MVLFFVAVMMVIAGHLPAVYCRLGGALPPAAEEPALLLPGQTTFVSVSSMAYRMKRNGAGLASICILSTMVLVTRLVHGQGCIFGCEDIAAYPSGYYRGIAEGRGRGLHARSDDLARWRPGRRCDAARGRSSWTTAGRDASGGFRAAIAVHTAAGQLFGSQMTSRSARKRACIPSRTATIYQRVFRAAAGLQPHSMRHATRRWRPGEALISLQPREL